MTDMTGSPPTAEDQGRLLEEALGMVRQQASQMRRCLENPGKLMDALKCGCVSKGVVYSKHRKC